MRDGGPRKNTLLYILLAVGGGLFLLCAGVGALVALGVSRGARESGRQATGADMTAAGEKPPALDMDDPRSVVAYWVSFKSSATGNATVDSPNERKEYEARVLGKHVRWPNTVSQVDAKGHVFVKDAYYWPFADRDAWKTQKDRPPRYVYHFSPVPGFGKPPRHEQTRGFPTRDPEWVKTLRPGSRVMVEGTIAEVQPTHYVDDITFPFHPQPVSDIGHYLVLADPLVTAP